MMNTLMTGIIAGMSAFDFLHKHFSDLCWLAIALVILNRCVGAS